MLLIRHKEAKEIKTLWSQPVWRQTSNHTSKLAAPLSHYDSQPGGSD